MKRRNLSILRRAIILGLAMLLMLPAFAEEIAVEDAPEAGALEVLEPQADADAAVEEAAGDLFISGEAADDAAQAEVPEEVPDAVISAAPAEATAAQAGDDVAANSNGPEPDYHATTYHINVGEQSSITLMLGDTLEVVFPDKNGKTWTSSKPSVIAAHPFSDSNSAVFSTRKKGSAKLTFTLTTGKKYTISVKLKDPYAPTGLTLSQSSVTLMAGMDLNLYDYISIEPAYARVDYTFKSSKSSVVKVDSKGVAVGMKAGSGTITVKAGRFTKKLKVRVKQNITCKLHATPTSKLARAQGKQWTLWPKSLEQRGNGSMICRLFLLNGTAGKVKGLRNLDLAITLDTENGEVLVARHAFSKVSVSCAKKRYTTVKLTIPSKDIFYSGVSLADLDASSLHFTLYGMPTAVNGKHAYAYNPTEIQAICGPVPDDPATYRALLVAEVDFYNSSTPGNARAWDHATRNRCDVDSMKAMLESVRTPDGGRYSVTTRYNTTSAGLSSAIRSAFADADENDVSLFFIATHGDVGNATPADDAGMLAMASDGEKRPENFRISELRDLLMEVPGKVVVIIESCGSGAAVYQSNASVKSAYNDAAAFDARVANLFADADPGVVEHASASGLATNTGELRRVNKFYVLCASAYRELSWGWQGASSFNFFTKWLIEGVGKSGSMPADKLHAGNRNGIVDLHELYRYISAVGDRYKLESNGSIYLQHVQVYPSDVRYPLFK